MQTKYLILILGLLIVILAHGDRGRKAGGSGRYIKSILGIENGNGRRIKGYDYIRVLAVIAVIGTHVVQSDICRQSRMDRTAHRGDRISDLQRAVCHAQRSAAAEPRGRACRVLL